MREFSNELRKIVIKVGSSSVSHENGGVDIERIEELAKEIVNLENKGIKVILVSSGAIATGANRLNVKRPRNDISKKQATAAVGQVTLMNTFLKAFAEYGYSIGQILLTRMVETNEVMNFNAKNTINDLLEMGVVPIVNENDTISTYEIDFGDNYVTDLTPLAQLPALKEVNCQENPISNYEVLGDSVKMVRDSV